MRVVLTVVALSALLVVRVGAEEMEPLRDDLSRAELFKSINPMDQKALKKRFIFPQDVEIDGSSSQPRQDSFFGVDISHHNEDNCRCKIDWSAMKSKGVAFVYLKASQGKKYFDPTFARNWKALGELPEGQLMHRGAYHFLSSDVSPVDQADQFLRVMPALAATDLPPCLDLEWDMRGGSDSWERVAKTEVAAKALAWLKRVKEQTGRTPIIYTNRNWWKQRVGEDRAKDFQEYPIWIADYSQSGLAVEKPGVPADGEWALWQFSENADLSSGGIPNQVDANIFKGKWIDFVKKLGLPE